MTRAGRRLLAAVATALATGAILVTLLAGYADRVAVSPNRFAGHAVTLVRSSGVESAIVGIITDRVVALTGDQGEVEPIVQRAVRAALANQRIATDIRDSAASLQRQLLSGTATSLTLTLPDIGPQIAAYVRADSPELAAELSSVGALTVLDVPVPANEERLIHDLARVGRDSWLLLILSLALVALALLLSISRARTLRALGIGAMCCGLLAVVLYLAGRQVVVNEFSSQAAQTAARAAWITYLSGLELWGFLLAAAGAVVALVATTQVGRRGNPDRELRELRDYDRVTRR